MAGPIAQPDNTIPSSMFINKAAADPIPANDEGRVPILETNAQLNEKFTSSRVLNILRTAKSNASLDGTENIFTVTLPANFFDDNVYIECELIFTTLQRAASGAANAAINAKLNGNNIITAAVSLQSTAEILDLGKF